MKVRKRIVVPIVVLAIAYWSAGLWLPYFATFLVQSENPTAADAVVVLAGDFNGLRILKAGELVRAGFAPIALVSGPKFYNLSESDVAIDFAQNRGYPRSLFSSITNQANSTENEAQFMLVEIRKRGYKRILVVTSHYHTRRAGRIWRRRAAALGVEVHIVGADDQDLVPDRWWQNREARKKLVLEWMKTLSGPLGV